MLDHRVEQRLVVVLQIAHVAVLAESGVARIEHSLAASPLIFERPDVRRQQPMQPEDVAFLFAECGALVQARIGEQFDAVQAGFERAACVFTASAFAEEFSLMGVSLQRFFRTIWRNCPACVQSEFIWPSMITKSDVP